MLAVVKEPRIRLTLEGADQEVAEVLDFLGTRYPLEVIEDDGEEVVDVRDADFWRQTTPGGLLEGCRALHGLTQEQLAAKCGIRATTISAYERGRRRLTRKAAARLAAAMGEPPEVLFP